MIKQRKLKDMKNFDKRFHRKVSGKNPPGKAPRKGSGVGLGLGNG